MSREHLLRELTRLRGTVIGDLFAYGGRSERERQYRWLAAVGSLSGRCEGMSFRSGAGIGGHAVRIGKPLLWPAGSGELERLRRECPLLQAEQLCEALTVPVPPMGSGAAGGVLLVGRRGGAGFTANDLQQAVETAERLAACSPQRSV